MRYEQILQALAACKGDGTWHEVAKLAGVHYDTVARIARGSLVPSVVICERIGDALAELGKAEPKTQTAA